MFTQRLLSGLKRSFGSTQDREKRIRERRAEAITEQVKKVLQSADQKLILMVRG